MSWNACSTRSLRRAFWMTGLASSSSNASVSTPRELRNSCVPRIEHHSCLSRRRGGHGTESEEAGERQGGEERREAREGVGDRGDREMRGQGATKGISVKGGWYGRMLTAMKGEKGGQARRGDQRRAAHLQVAGNRHLSGVIEAGSCEGAERGIGFHSRVAIRRGNVHRILLRTGIWQRRGALSSRRRACWPKTAREHVFCFYFQLHRCSLSARGRKFGRLPSPTKGGQRDGRGRAGGCPPASALQSRNCLGKSNQ